jgi:lycopene cyclase domain-containing protein
VPANILVAIPFLIWDILFTKNGIWGFNPEYVLGLYLFNLPIEEVLFFVCIPFSCVFTYHCLNSFFSFQWKQKTESVFAMGLSLFLLLVGLCFYSRFYTSFAFISLGLLLLLLVFIVRVNWFQKLILIYPILLIPFFIVNGILTGSGLEHPVVWYNDSENLGIRLFTIPVEDIFYGFELILLNVYFYEFFKHKFNTA